MKFQPDTQEGVNLITRHEPGRLWVGSMPFARSLIIPWTGPPLPWRPADFDALAPEHFEELLALRPEVVIFGSGPRIRCAPAALMRALIDKGIGVETMDTAAACRTYNVLAAEKRSVVAALLLEQAVADPA